MKKFFQENKRLAIAMLAGLCLILGIGAGTLAYNMSVTSQVNNSFTVGDVTTEITEKVTTDSGIEKKVTVLNTGKNDCYVRARVTVSPEEAIDANSADGTKWISGTDWSYNSADGFYYYSEPVSAQGEAENPFGTSELIIKPTLADGFVGDLEITVYQEAVQATAVIDGVEKTDMATIWSYYNPPITPVGEEAQ